MRYKITNFQGSYTNPRIGVLWTKETAAGSYGPYPWPGDFMRKDLINDGQWHVVSVPVYNGTNWNGTITGLRLDYFDPYPHDGNDGSKMDIDFITVSKFPMVGEGKILTLTSTDEYYPTAGSTTTFYAKKIDNCGATSCATTTVTVQSEIPNSTISAAQTICSGETPNNITQGLSIMPSLLTGTTVSYRWEKSTTSATAGFSVISGATGSTLTSAQMGPLTQTTWYRRITIFTLNSLSCEGNPTTAIKITVNPLPATPTFTSVSPTADICYGTNITYTTQTGMHDYVWTFPGTAGTDYTLVSGGNATSNTAVIAWNDNTNGTTVSVNYQNANNCAAATAGTNSSITLPPHSSILSGNESATCFLSGSNPVHFYAPTTGHYIGSINPDGNSGTVTMTSYLHTFGSTPGVDDGTMYACDHPGEQFRTAFMERSFTVIPTGTITGTGNMNVYVPFTSAEFTQLQNNAINKTPVNTVDNVTTIANLGITQHHDLGNENGVPYDNCLSGATHYITQNQSGSNLSTLNLPSAVTANYVRFSVTNFSEFYLHGLNDGSPLPIELSNFSGNCTENGVYLNWTTATESNVHHFEIERSRDGQSWEVIASREAAGNSSTANDYQVTDNDYFELTYYRLRSVDNNGEYQVYGPISVVCKNLSNSWSIHPVPVSTHATVTLNASEAHQATLVILDVNGRSIRTKDIEIHEGSNLYDLDLSKLSEGAYTIRLMGNPSLRPLKFVKIN